MRDNKAICRSLCLDYANGGKDELIECVKACLESLEESWELSGEENIDFSGDA